jgi:hypothetical protein
MNFRLDLAKHPGPQLDYLESIYNHLNTNKVTIPPTIQGMMMLNILPSKWESTLILMALTGTTISQMSLKVVNAFIINFWESEQNKHPLPKAQKLSAIKRQNQHPSFDSQMQGGSYKPKEKKKKPIKRGTRGGKGKERATSHIASVASLPSPPLVHVASFSPAGMVTRTAHASLPAAGQSHSPVHPTVISACSLAERIGVETTTNNLKTLEQHITMPQHKYGGRITASKRTSTPPPSPPTSTSASMSVADWDAQLTAERLHDDEEYPQVSYEEHFGVTLPSVPNTPSSDCVSLFGDEDIELENWARRELDGAACHEFNDDESVILPSHIYGTNVSSVDRASKGAAVMEKDISVLNKYVHNCKTSDCPKCEKEHKNSMNWLLDSGATWHFTHLIKDFISYEALKDALTVQTASKPIFIKGFGAVLIKHKVTNKHRKKTITTVLHPVYYIPEITTRLLSLGVFLQEGMHVYGNVTKLSIAYRKSLWPVVECTPRIPSDTVYWLKSNIADQTKYSTMTYVDYDLMHKHLGHPSQDVLHYAPKHTKGFPPMETPEEIPICPGCAEGKMPSKAYPPSDTHAEKPFEKIHSDIKSFPVESYHKYKYFISFVDDYSSYSWVTLLCTKGAAINALM